MGPSRRRIRETFLFRHQSHNDGKYTAELGARIAGLPDHRLVERTRPPVTCGGMGCWSSDGQVGMTVDGSVAVSPGIGQEGVGYAVEFAIDGLHVGPELVRRVFPDAGSDVTVHFYPDGPVTPADIRASQDVALDIGNFEVFVTLSPEKGLTTRLSASATTWTSPSGIT